MKNFKSPIGLMILFAMLVFSSCGKDDINQTNETQVQTEEQINFDDLNLQSKEITISDESQENSITIKVSTDDAQVLEAYSAEVFDVTFREKTNQEKAEVASRLDNTSENTLDPQVHEDDAASINVFIEVIDQNLVNDEMTFSIKTNEIEGIQLRAYNLVNWYKATHQAGLKVTCTGRGLDGLSAYGYHSTSSCNYIGNCYSSKYFHSSGYKNFWRQYGKCLWVKVVHYHNRHVTYL